MAAEVPRPPARIAFYDAYAGLEGAGLALLDIIRRLDRSRFQPIGLLPREGPLADALDSEGCPVEVIAPGPPLDSYGGRVAGGGPLTKLRAAASLAAYSGRIARWLREREVALLHCNQTRAAVQAGPGGRRAGVPVLWNVRIRERMPLPLVRLADWCADRIVPLTPDTFSGLSIEGRLLGRSTIIRNAVDARRFSLSRDGAGVRAELGIAPDAPIILSVGVLVPRKGFDALVRALPAVLAQVPAARLLIAGGPPGGGIDSRENLLALADELGVTGSVTLLGRRDDVPELLAAADVFVLASRHEGDPAAVLEAMATARPVVVTPPAAAAVEDGRNGLVVPQGDVGTLGQALIGLLRDPDRARALGNEARRTVERNHDVGQMVRRYERVYLEMLAGEES